jgi:hypothetical protein
MAAAARGMRAECWPREGRSHRRPEARAAGASPSGQTEHHHPQQQSGDGDGGVFMAACRLCGLARSCLLFMGFGVRGGRGLFPGGIGIGFSSIRSPALLDPMVWVKIHFYTLNPHVTRT